MTHDEATERFFKDCLGWEPDALGYWHTRKGNTVCVDAELPPITKEMESFKIVIEYARELGYEAELPRCGDRSWFGWRHQKMLNIYTHETKDDNWFLAAVELAVLKIPREVG